VHLDNCFYLGYISKIIGTKGELAFKLDVDSPSSYCDLPHVFIQMQMNDQQVVPYFILKSSLQGGLLRCRLEGIETAAEAKALVGKSLFLPLEALPPLKGSQFYFHEIIGFSVHDQEKGDIGMVAQVLEYPHSNLLSVQQGDREILIPITDESIVEVDRQQKLLRVQAPAGLIDLYLGEG
jgi:16S rRNA processing protein RimM